MDTGRARVFEERHVSHAIETLKIEKYRLLAMLRNIDRNEHELLTNFNESRKQTDTQLDNVNQAIELLVDKAAIEDEYRPLP